MPILDTVELRSEGEQGWSLWGIRQVREREGWRFLGWVAVGVCAAVVLYDVRAWYGVRNPLDYFLPLALALAAVVLLRVSSKTVTLRRRLASFTHEAASVAALGEVDPEGEGAEVALVNKVEVFCPVGSTRVGRGELTHVVFGLIDYPWPGRKGVAMEAFALYLAKGDGTPVPLVEATHDKLVTYQVGGRLAELLALPLIELGKGR